MCLQNTSFKNTHILTRWFVYENWQSIVNTVMAEDVCFIIILIKHLPPWNLNKTIHTLNVSVFILSCICHYLKIHFCLHKLSYQKWTYYFFECLHVVFCNMINKGCPEWFVIYSYNDHISGLFEKKIVLNFTFRYIFQQILNGWQSKVWSIS